MKSIFFVLGNQLFEPKYLRKYKDCCFFMSEDYGLCTYIKHHKLKILLSLSAMRSYKDLLEKNNFKADDITGVKFNPIRQDFLLSDFNKINYFLTASKK